MSSPGGTGVSGPSQDPVEAKSPREGERETAVRQPRLEKVDVDTVGDLRRDRPRPPPVRVVGLGDDVVATTEGRRREGVLVVSHTTHSPADRVDRGPSVGSLWSLPRPAMEPYGLGRKALREGRNLRRQHTSGGLSSKGKNQ